MSSEVAAIILAAGQSRRMGQPKMLLPWGKSIVLAEVAAGFAQAGIAEIVVVTGANRAKMEDLVTRLAQDFPVRAVHNAGYESGEMLSSIQCGLAALGPQVSAALIGLGDQPQMRPATIRSVVEEFERCAARIVVPSYHRRRGHPWLVERSLWPELAGLGAGQTARDFLDRHAGEIRYVEVNTSSVNEDLDTPEDYRRYNHD